MDDNIVQNAISGISSAIRIIESDIEAIQYIIDAERDVDEKIDELRLNGYDMQVFFMEMYKKTSIDELKKDIDDFREIKKTLEKLLMINKFEVNVDEILKCRGCLPSFPWHLTFVLKCIEDYISEHDRCNSPPEPGRSPPEPGNDKGR